MLINIWIKDKFDQWKEKLDEDLGTAPEDWGPWYKCFAAGFLAGTTFGPKKGGQDGRV